MRFGTGMGLSALQMVVRRHLNQFTVTRPTYGDGRFGESSESETTHLADLWVYNPEEQNIGTEYGDRLEGDLQALCFPSEDIEHEDRIDYGGFTYEVNDVVQLPDAGSPRLKLVSLVRRVND